MDYMTMARIEQTVHDNLQGAQVIALVPDPNHDTVREGYWERAWAVTWRRPLRNGQPDQSGDGFTYATHRVHVNSTGEAACFDGHYDQERMAALADMNARANIVIPAAEQLDTTVMVTFEPQAIRDHYDGSDDDSEEGKWVAAATDEQLLAIGQECVGRDSLWREFGYLLDSEIKWAIALEKKEAKDAQ